MLLIRKEAELELQEAYDWYESQQPSLGASFLTEIESVLEIVQKSPKIYGILFKSTRRALCKRFPYAIYYIESTSNIVVLAVMQQCRNPEKWQKRS